MTYQNNVAEDRGYFKILLINICNHRSVMRLACAARNVEKIHEFSLRYVHHTRGRKPEALRYGYIKKK